MSEKTIDIYHGSANLIREPVYGAGRKNNDYGPGFYCTEAPELAKEWACTPVSDGFSNHYVLRTDLLNVLDLNSENYSILNWMAVLAEHRSFRSGTPIEGRARKYLRENFYVNVNAYDLVIGYRADDAYYDFADAFLNNAITVDQLAVAMKLGRLGEQVVLKSQFAFDSLSFADFETADHNKYCPLRKARAEAAGNDYARLSEEETDGIYMIDLIREEVKNDDARIPRNVPAESDDKRR